MKRFIFAAISVVILGICGIGALLAAGYQKNNQLQTPVFKFIAEEDADGFLALCDPRLREEIDPPVLQSWMMAMNTALGECRFEPAGSFGVSIERDSEKTIIKSSGAVQFEHGNAKSDLVFLNGRIIQFKIDTDRLSKGWFTGPAESDYYQNRSEVVIQTLLDRRLDQLKTMMHPALLEAASDKTLNHICDLGDSWIGNVTSITATGEEFQRTDNDELVVRLQVIGENGVIDATVTFTFDGLKGHLTAFNLQPAE